MADPDCLYGPVVARNSVVLVWITARSDIFHRGCSYTVIQTVQKTGMCSAIYDTVYYKSWKSFNKSRPYYDIAIIQSIQLEGYSFSLEIQYENKYNYKDEIK